MNSNQDNAAFLEKIAEKILQDIEDEERAEAEKAAQEKQQADEEVAMVAMAEHLLQHINSVLSNS